CLLFFGAPAATAVYTLSLHDALPIYRLVGDPHRALRRGELGDRGLGGELPALALEPGRAQGQQQRRVEAALHVGDLGLGHLEGRSEEHTSELQSRENLVCRLLLEKKK